MSQFQRPLLRSLRFITLPLAAALAASLHGAPSAAADPLDPGPGLRELATVSARGVQVHACRHGAAGPAWTFVEPEAELRDARGQLVGHHGAGPHWTAADGSRIEGQVVARQEAPAAGAIPWLLLRTRSAGNPGQWSAVTAVQRVQTVGGLAPAQGCDANHVGAMVRVPYRADYRLFVPA